ncbi:MAG: SDR family oxidoreductase [Clostridiales bacterium]|nr:SDR family oxidoreductase [Clostridiales bacterium]
MHKTALVTGASSGIGLATARALHAAGYTVYGTSRNPDAGNPEYEGIRYLPLELTDPGSIERLAAMLPPLDVLVNNAGSSQMGAIEETPSEKILELYETLLFGNIRLIQRVLPGMRARGRGWIVNVSSLAELMPVPCSAVYASAKAALHMLGTGLRQELRPFGIRVVTVAPSFIKTSIVQERLHCDNSPYSDMIQSAGRIRDAEIASGSPPEAVAEKIVKIVGMKNPSSFYPAGKKATLLAIASKWLPERLREWAVRKRFRLR